MSRVKKNVNLFFSKKEAKLLAGIGIFIVAAVASWLFFVYSQVLHYENITHNENTAPANNSEQTEGDESSAYAKEPSPPPAQVKAIYITSPLAFKNGFDDIASIAEDTEVNSIVITMKSGGGVYKDRDNLVEDIVRKFKERGVYTIARLTVFQDNALARSRPDLALKFSSGSLWRDGSGAYWLDPASREVWDYNIKIAKETLDFGFDELNFDYIRFPSDGAISSIRYPVWSGAESKADIIREFFAYFTKELKDYEPRATLSADIFAYVLLTHIDDAGIGQRLEDAASYFDVVAPMIYPSHYSSGNFGFINPAAHPYEVTLKTLEDAKGRLDKLEGEMGIVRPWLQAFHMGAIYGREMVNLEKQAVEDAGFHSGWMLWNPRNRYPAELFDISPE